MQRAAPCGGWIVCNEGFAATEHAAAVAAAHRSLHRVSWLWATLADMQPGLLLLSKFSGVLCTMYVRVCGRLLWPPSRACPWPVAVQLKLPQSLWVCFFRSKTHVCPSLSSVMFALIGTTISSFGCMVIKLLGCIVLPGFGLWLVVW